MKELMIFNNEEFGKIRTTSEGDKPYLCLSDLCKILEIKNTSDCKSRLNPKGIVIVDTLTKGGKQPMIYIDENNLYKVIFQSRKPEAEKFTEWVTSEVLPSIRKNGGYLVGQEEMTEDEIMAKALLYANNKINDLKAKNERLEVQNSQLLVSNETMKPKADYFDDLVDKNLLTGIRETAKELKVKEKAFVKFLLERKYLYRDKKGKLQPNATKNQGLFEIKEFKNDKTNFCGTQLFVTPKGRETFRLLYI